MHSHRSHPVHWLACNLGADICPVSDVADEESPRIVMPSICWKRFVASPFSCPTGGFHTAILWRPALTINFTFQKMGLSLSLIRSLARDNLDLAARALWLIRTRKTMCWQVTGLPIVTVTTSRYLHPQGRGCNELISLEQNRRNPFHWHSLLALTCSPPNTPTRRYPIHPVISVSPKAGAKELLSNFKRL
jgi:hypothetical protein